MKRHPLVCFGDSITHCHTASDLGRWSAILAARLEVWSPGKYEVFNRGLNSNTSALALDRIHTEVLPLLPGWVILEFGINDAYVFPWAAISRVSVNEYRRNLGELTRQIQAKGGHPVWIINHPLTERTDRHPQGNGQSINQNLQPHNNVLREFVRAAGLPFIDLPQALQEAGHSPDALLTADGVHLSPDGNRLYAELVFSELQPLLAAA